MLTYKFVLREPPLIRNWKYTRWNCFNYKRIKISINCVLLNINCLMNTLLIRVTCSKPHRSPPLPRILSLSLFIHFLILSFICTEDFSPVRPTNTNPISITHSLTFDHNLSRPPSGEWTILEEKMIVSFWKLNVIIIITVTLTVFLMNLYKWFEALLGPRQTVLGRWHHLMTNKTG